ncbi:tRNA-dihydrouridine(16/17) synthase [NAD(P)(+)]-like [Mytilus edulis]|uniref:tRNA-dihydrouridine(16/17) synthase [NAD(P)(+)]-like n=1 Tax=Mytilus edulis TaxID=6550 RepID=UPI0039EEF25D
MEKLEGFEFWKKTLKSAKYVVAPMVDQSELAWRMLSRRYGAELCYTPMLHSLVFCRDANYRADSLQSCPEDRPLIIQFCANDPEVLLKAGLLAQDHCDAIDLNLGCPQVIAKRGHYGAFLQDEWDLIEKMVKVCHENLKVPITCKVRIFESIQKTVLYAQMLEKAGCQLLTVHGRTREQKGLNTGLATWEHIKAVREKLKIPVYANGNIQYLPDVDRCIKDTGVHGVMTAEGNLHNPALFKGIDPPVYQMGEEYLQLVDKYPCPVSYVRGHLFKMFQHALQVHLDIREMIGSGKSVECFKTAVLLLKERCLEDIKKYNERKEEYKSDLPHPYWICQPYVRPTPEQAEENLAKKVPTKRQIHMENPPPELAGLSKNKLKKKLRNPYKNFDRTPGRESFDRCVECTNPRGKRCDFQLCKSCCKKKVLTETLDCIGHNILVKTRKEKEMENDLKEKELNNIEKSAVERLSENNVTNQIEDCDKSDSEKCLNNSSYDSLSCKHTEDKEQAIVNMTLEDSVKHCGVQSADSTNSL